MDSTAELRAWAAGRRRLKMLDVRRDPAQLFAHLVESVYPDPSVMTDVEFARYRHDDVPGLEGVALEDERFMARLRRASARAVSRRPSHWLRDRIRILDGEHARRQRRAGR
jgi:hypothetical protein